ncbi:MAG TPA: flavodoxin domain-containing protein [Meiothermus sp.]|jgi:menaquinone-dependent protoporphyrinogen oxidase|nr:flavodoxin domain-containing protein [Meiothermus sp.]
MLAKPILIAYATRGGTTQGVAEGLGRVLREKGALVEVRPVEQVKNLVPYRAVVVGSGVRDERWLPEATHFVEHHREALQQLPLVYFLVYSPLRREPPERIEQVRGFLDGVRQMAEPLEVGIFARDLDATPPPMLVKAQPLPQGDWSDWQSPEAWAARLYERFA